MIYWALGPLVRSITLPVDPGDIRPPQYRTTRIFSLGLGTSCHYQGVYSMLSHELL
jgi:hypothetical protein